MTEIICKQCRVPYPEEGAPHRCPECGGYFRFDGNFPFEPSRIEAHLPGMWRYRHAFGLFPGAPVVSLGEGTTPLVWEECEGLPVGLKMESLNPTGSYKDRGSAVLVSQLARRGVRAALEDSSGNAGASFAAYAARARMRARVFVPESAAGPKRRQIEMYAAELVRVPGPRSAAAQAVLDEVAKGGVYASHAFMPFGLAGIATIAYEVWESLGKKAPGSIIAPTGHGGLLRGIIMGFQSLQEAGLVEGAPYYVGVQAAACAPIAAAYEQGPEAMEAVEEGLTVAEGVRVRQPSQAEWLLGAVSGGRGEFIAIEERAILPAMGELGERGIYVEPTAALAWCALKECIGDLPGPVVAIITGSGLKYSG